jgi:hypothetical protein
MKITAQQLLDIVKYPITVAPDPEQIAQWRIIALDVIIDDGYKDKEEAEKQADRIKRWVKDMGEEKKAEENRAETLSRIKDFQARHPHGWQVADDSRV